MRRCKHIYITIIFILTAVSCKPPESTANTNSNSSSVTSPHNTSDSTLYFVRPRGDKGVRCSDTPAQCKIYVDKSTDGISWTPVVQDSVKKLPIQTHVVYVFEMNNKIALFFRTPAHPSGYRGAVFVSEDGASWDEVTQTTPLPAPYVGANLFKLNDKVYVVGGFNSTGRRYSGDLFVTEDLKTWTKVTQQGATLPGDHFAVIAQEPNTIYLFKQFGGEYSGTFDDAGTTLTVKKITTTGFTIGHLPEYSRGFARNRSLYYIPRYPYNDRAGQPTQIIQTSTDSGASWATHQTITFDSNKIAGYTRAFWFVFNERLHIMKAYDKDTMRLYDEVWISDEEWNTFTPWAFNAPLERTVNSSANFVVIQKK